MILNFINLSLKADKTFTQSDGKKKANLGICLLTKLTGPITVNIKLPEESLKTIQRKSIGH